MSATADLDDYFRTVGAGAYASLWRIEVHLLDHAQVAELTRKFDFHPVVTHLRGAVLDDPNTSNHHVLIGRAPLEGHVLYLSHDGDSRVVFSSLTELLVCAERARTERISLPELHPVASPVSPDQVELSNLIRSLVAEDQVDVALALVPSMDLSDKDLLAQLIAHDDFFLGEAVAGAIQVRPEAGLASLARMCAEHQHPQVAQAGRRALAACAK